MRITLLFLSLLTFGLCQGQNLLLLRSDSSFMQSSAFIQISSEFNYRSNALNNLFMDRMYLGGFIDEDLKDQVGSELTSQNRFGGTVNGNLSYWSFKDSLFSNNQLGLMLQLEQRADTYLSFTDDFFNLMYRGVDPFVGKTADLSRLYAGAYTYQKYGVGVFDKRTFSYARVSLVNGQSFFQSSISEASLYVDPNIDTLQLDYLGTLNFSDSTRRKFNQNNGLGAAFDIEANILLKNDGGLLKVSFQNIGFIRWNNKTHQYSADTSMVYTGLDIQDIFNGENTGNYFPSLSDTLAYDRKQEGHTTLLPGSASVSLIKKIKDDNYFEVGLKIQGNRAYVPLIYGGYQYMLNQNSIITARASYGGYGDFRVGGHYERIHRGWYMIIGTEDLPGFFLRDKYGKNVYFSLGKFIGLK